MTPETIAKIKGILRKERAIGQARLDCDRALRMLDEVPKYRSENRPSYIGRVSHPILEAFFMNVLIKRGVLSKHEYQFNKPASFHRIDTAIEIQPSFLELITAFLGINLKDFDAVFIDYVIPSEQKFRTAVMGKLDKNYQGKKKLFVVVFYGFYSSVAFSRANEEISRSMSPYKENVRFRDVIDFAKALGFLSKFEIEQLEKINALIIKALKGDDEALQALEDRQNDALLELSEFKNRYLGDNL